MNQTNITIIDMEYKFFKSGQLMIGRDHGKYIYSGWKRVIFVYSNDGHMVAKFTLKSTKP